MKTALFRSKVLPLMVVGLMTMAAGCVSTAKPETAPTAEADNKRVTLITTFKSGTLDPHADFTPIRAGVTETLVRLGANLQIEGWLATKWEAQDETTWVFTIRDGITFHDGSPVDGAAVKASLERAIGTSRALANALKIDSIEASGQTVTIKTTQPVPALPSELVNPHSSVVSVAAEQRMGRDAFNNAPVGTGPFKVKRFTPNIEIQLERNDEYWAGKPKLKEATYKFNEDANVRALALQSKEAEIVYNPPAEAITVIQRDAALKVESVPGMRVHFLVYNQQKPLMQDLKVRQAIDLLLNRESIAQDIMLGNATPANGPFNTSLPFGSKEPVVKQDAAKAKAMLEEAGFQAGADGKLMKDGKPLTLELITYRARPELPLIAQLLQSDAAKAGVTIQIKTVENVDSYLQENKDWDLATYSNGTSPRGDGGIFLNNALTPTGTLNPGKINIARLNELVNQLNATSDLAQRVNLTQEAVAVINQEIPHSYAVYPNIIVGMNKRVTGWTPGGEEYYMLTHTMDVK